MEGHGAAGPSGSLFRTVIAAAVGLLGVLLAACGGAQTEATPTPVPGTGGTPASTEQAAWEIEWEELLNAARQEEVVIALGGVAGRTLEPVWQEFERRTGVKTVLSLGSGSEQADRVLAERAGGRYTVDLMLSSTTSANRLSAQGVFDPIADYFMLPDVVDTSLWYGGQYYYGDVQGQFHFLYGHTINPLPVGTTVYNTNLVTPADIEAINSVWDLFDPKWKGRVAGLSPAEAGVGTQYVNIYVHPEIGKEWILRYWTEMDAEFPADQRLLADGIAQGKWAWGINVGSGVRDLLIVPGIPMEEFVKPVREATTMTASQGLSLVNRAPNPNAAKAAVNWFFSQEGQTAMHELSVGDPNHTMRTDVTVAGNVNPKDVRQPGVNYLFLNDPQYYNQYDEAQEWRESTWRQLEVGR